MINLEWVAHRSGVHQMAPASADIKDPEGNLLVTSYAVARPDGNWSLMLVNRDETNPHTVKVVFEDSKAKRSSYFAGPVRLVTWGSEQYVWHNDGPNSHPDPDHAPVGMHRGWRGASHLHAAASLRDRVAGQVGARRALKQMYSAEVVSNGTGSSSSGSHHRARREVCPSEHQAHRNLIRARRYEMCAAERR